MSGCNGASGGPSSELAELIDGLAARLQAGEVVDVEAVAREHPGHAEELRRLLPALGVLDELSRSGEEGASGLAAPPAELVSGVLGDFRILREVGRGGMGVVYEAEQLSLGRRVALKVLPFAATMDPRQLQRFHNEARAAASLDHPHIVHVHAVGCERAMHFYAMQFIDGQTLAAMIADLRRAGGRPLPPDAQPTAPHAPQVPADTAPQAADSTERRRLDRAYFRRVAELGAQAAEALDHAHALGIVHRDVKPANLLVDGRGGLWVTDFGLAHVQSDARLTMTGDLVGTLRYMSPEQALAKRVVVDHRTDVYSLGATLYELLTLRPAFGGSDRQELLRQIAFEEPVAPRRLERAVPAELETIVLKALEKDPADRYATAKELADDLRRYLLDEPIRARRSSLVQRARKVARRHPGVTVTAAVAVIVGLLLGVAGLAVSNHRVRQEQTRTQGALKQAEDEKAIAKAVRDFLRNKLLLQADARVQAEALRRGGRAAVLEPNPRVCELLDRAADELTPDRIDGQFPGQPLVQAEILKTVGEAYDAIGKSASAIPHLERARDLHTRELGPGHPDTLATVSSLARAQLDAGKAKDAALLFEQVRDLRRETLGPGHPDTLASMNDLYRCYFRLGQHARALQLREEIVGLRKASLGPDHRDTLESMMNLANSYAALRRFEEAMQLHQKTLALRKAKLGEDDPDTLASMNDVANCHAALHQDAESLRLHRETLDRRRARLGPDHPHTLQSMNNVAVACSALGRHAEARKRHEETLALRKVKLPRGHPDTVQSMNALAWILANCPDRKLRDPSKALELAKETVELAPGNGGYRNTLGTAHYRVGDWKNTVKTLMKSTQLRKGGDATDWFFLAMAHWRLGEKDQGRAWYDRAVQAVEKSKRPDEDLRQFHAEAAELLGVGRQ
jgi:serine/threonine protein kinase